MCSSDLLCWHSAPAVWAVLDSPGGPEVDALVVGRLQSEEGRARFRPHSRHDPNTLQ